MYKTLCFLTFWKKLVYFIQNKARIVFLKPMISMSEMDLVHMSSPSEYVALVGWIKKTINDVQIVYVCRSKSVPKMPVRLSDCLVANYSEFHRCLLLSKLLPWHIVTPTEVVYQICNYRLAKQIKRCRGPKSILRKYNIIPCLHFLLLKSSFLIIFFIISFA